MYANSRSRIVVSSGRLSVSSANIFCIACQYFFVLSAILFAWSANTLRILRKCFFRWSTFYKFLQSLQILKHSYLSCPIINIDHCSLIHIKLNFLSNAPLLFATQAEHLKTPQREHECSKEVCHGRWITI